MDEVEPHFLNQDDIYELQYMLAMVDAMEKPKIKILLTYLIYPLAMATYFKKALQHRDDVDLKVAGTYTGSWIPWNGGMNLPNKYAIPPDIPLPFSPSVNEYNYEIIKAQLGDWVPDLIIQIDAGFHFKYKPSDGMVVTVGTDPHVLNDFYDVPRKYSDKFFNMQKVYSKAGDIYLPYAYSKYDVYPEEKLVDKVLWGERDTDGNVSRYIENLYKDTDACLIGLQYTHVPRLQWIEELRKRGVSILAENGPVFDEARNMYNRARIGLNWSSMDDLNCRWFELPAFKICSVSNYVPDAHLFMEPDKDYLEFTTLPEAIEKVMWAKEHPQEAQEIAQSGYNKILLHTFDQRVDQLLKECGFVTN
jgi:glycosyl transferase family 1